MKRLFLLLLALVALFFGVRALVRALASDETKIRWLLEDVTAGFNATRMNPILDALHPDFRDKTYGADKELVRAALAHVFFERKDATTKRFLYRADLLEEEPSIVVRREEPPVAKAHVLVELHEVHGEDTQLLWKARAHVSLLKTDGGWKITYVDAETLAGARLR